MAQYIQWEFFEKYLILSIPMMIIEDVSSICTYGFGLFVFLLLHVLFLDLFRVSDLKSKWSNNFLMYYSDILP